VAYLVDSYAWIEYLRGSSNGEKVNKILNSKDCFTLNLVISEVVSKLKREKKDYELAYTAIINNSKILFSSPKFSKEIGLLHAEMKSKSKNFGLIDAHLLFLSKEFNLKIITGDMHFKNHKNVLFLN